MKWLFILVVPLLLGDSLMAQTWSEWTRQKKTQIKYLLQQIAAYEAHMDYLKQGYAIAQKGLTAIQTIQNGEWMLHQDYFGSLKMVRSPVKGYAKIADLMALQLRMVRQCRALVKNARESRQLAEGEADYLQQVSDRLLAGLGRDLDELTAVLLPGERGMTEDERIRRMDRIHSELQEKQVFLGSFSSSVRSLCRSRSQDQIEVELSQKLNAGK